MLVTNNILLIASLLTSVGVIVATAVKIYKFIRKWEKWVDEQSVHSLDNYMSILQLKIMSPYMPLSERIKAGDIYVKLGGNGEVKQKYHYLLSELDEEEYI
jgi:hypothetical protein